MSKTWTDDEIGYLTDTLSLPAQEVADALGRTVSSVKSCRSRVRNGWAGPVQLPWSTTEEAVIMAFPYATADEIATKLPGRTSEAVTKRRSTLGAEVVHRQRKNPQSPGPRTMVARTCTTCGLLLPGAWFSTTTRTGKGRVHSRSCRKCNSADDLARVQRDDKYADKKRSAANAYQQMAQAITAPLAENGGQDYTEADHKILSDQTLTGLEKALRMKRTYNAVLIASGKFGYRVRGGTLLGDPAEDQWLIDNPNAGRIEEITASLQREPVGAGPTRPEWDWED